MKNIKASIADNAAPIGLLVIPFLLLLTSCDQRKAEIEADNNTTIENLDQQVKDVDEAAGLAKIQVEESAAIIIAGIDEERDTAKAQIEAEKAKADAEAEAAKARLDAVQD
jgi:peptide deformylase